MLIILFVVGTNWEAPIFYEIDEQKSVSSMRFEHIQMQWWGFQREFREKMCGGGNSAGGR